MKTVKLRREEALGFARQEALNAICSNLLLQAGDSKKLLLTGCESAAGQAELAIRIARHLAQRGMRVAVIDAALRRAGMAQDDRSGLASFLAGEKRWNEIVHPTELDGVCFIPAGPYAGQPPALLAKPAFAGLLDNLAQNYDVLFVIAPPAGLTPDAADIARHCDGCILMLDYAKTRGESVKRVKRRIEQSGCEILGCILNNVLFDTIRLKKAYSRWLRSYQEYEKSKRIGER